MRGGKRRTDRSSTKAPADKPEPAALLRFSRQSVSLYGLQPDDVYPRSQAGRPGATPVDFGIGTSSSSSPSMLPSPRLHRRRSYSTLTSLTSDSPDDERTDAASSSDEPETANARRLLSAPLLDEKGPSLSGEAGKRLWRMQSHGKHRHHHHQHDSDGDDSNGDDDDRHNAKDTLVCELFLPSFRLSR